MNKPMEGDIYKVISLHGKEFTIRYGYYADYERENHKNDPIPIYPDFEKTPVYTDEGYPFVTQIQDLCPHGESLQKEAFCIDCPHFNHGEELIGICKNHKRKRKEPPL